jgi:hypothetical protein
MGVIAVCRLHLVQSCVPCRQIALHFRTVGTKVRCRNLVFVPPMHTYTLKNDMQLICCHISQDKGYELGKIQFTMLGPESVLLDCL